MTTIPQNLKISGPLQSKPEPIRLETLLAVACYAALAMTCMAATASARAINLDREGRFDIQSQAVDKSLLDFSKQADIQVIISPEADGSAVAPPIVGRLLAGDALEMLLKNTGLKYSSVGSSVFISSRQLAKHVSVSAAASRPVDISENNIPPASVRSDESSERKTASPNAAPEVVVTAQKREERLQNVPISISVLSGDELDKSTAQGVSDALNSVPGVATTQNYLGGGTSVVIRGVQAAGPLFTGSSPVSYYLDSVPFGLIRSAVAPDQDAYDLERVEVLRGPQGTLYGASALNGVVRVLSTDPNLSEFDLKARASDSSTQYGGNNYRGDAAVNVPLVPGVLAARLVVGYENDSGWIDQINKNNVNKAELRNYRVKLKAQATDDLSVALSAWRSSDQYGAPSFGYTFDKSSSLLDQPVFTIFDAYGLKIDDSFGGITVSSMTSYLDYNNAGSLDLLPFGFPGSIFFSGLISNIFSQELNLGSGKDGDWRWSVGGIYIKGTENNVASYTLIGIPTETVDMTSKSYAGYGEITRILFGGRLEITGGLRHYHDDVAQLGQLDPSLPFVPSGGKFEANTPRGILTWHLKHDVMVYSSYSQGFRSGFPQDPTVPLGFPSANPDRLRNYELGSKGSVIGGDITYDTSIYYMRWTGIQQQLLVPYQELAAGTLAIVNGQAASGFGVDVAVSARPVPDLSLSIAASWNNLQMDKDVVSGDVVLFGKGDRPNYSPETTASGSIAYTYHLGAGYNLTAGASVNYTSQQLYRTLVVGPPSTALTQAGDPITTGRVDITLTAANKWSAMVFVNNVNNERGTPIQPFVQVENWNARIRPRTYGLQLDYHFH